MAPAYTEPLGAAPREPPLRCISIRQQHILKIYIGQHHFEYTNIWPTIKKIGQRIGEKRSTKFNIEETKFVHRSYLNLLSVSARTYTRGGG